MAPHSIRRPLGNTMASFPIAVRTALVDWRKLFAAREAQFNVSGGSIAEELDAPIPKSPYTDEGRTAILEELNSRYFVSFADWTYEEVEIFVRLAFPYHILSDLTKKGEPSTFLSRVFFLWKPTFYDWIIFMWNFSGHACEFFSDLLLVMPDTQKPRPDIIGKVLFVDMIRAKHYIPLTCVSMISAIIPYSRERSAARKHAQAFLELSRCLSVEAIGFIIRSHIIHLAQPDNCPCGYKPGELACKCFRTDGSENAVIFQHDNNREYMCVLLRLIIEQLKLLRRVSHPNAPQWTTSERDLLIMSACDYVFTEATYFAVYNSIVLGANSEVSDFVRPAIAQTCPRLLTEEEQDNLTVGGREADVENGRIQTGSCAIINCKQISKVDCANVSCQTHCPQGLFCCHVHRKYNAGNADRRGYEREYRQRRNVYKNVDTPMEPRHANKRLIARGRDDI